MRFGIFGVLLSFVVVVQCDDDLSLLNDLRSLDFKQIIDDIFSTNFTDFDDITQSQLADDTSTLRGRSYDWNKCAIEFGTIADGLTQTQWWAMQCNFS